MFCSWLVCWLLLYKIVHSETLPEIINIHLDAVWDLTNLWWCYCFGGCLSIFVRLTRNRCMEMVVYFFMGRKWRMTIFILKYHLYLPDSDFGTWFWVTIIQLIMTGKMLSFLSIDCSVFLWSHNQSVCLAILFERFYMVISVVWHDLHKYLNGWSSVRRRGSINRRFAF